MSSSRVRIIQDPPDPNRDYRGYPQATLSANKATYRCHNVTRGPGWFSSDGSGRFDLPPPNGTMYVADDPVVAFRESLGDVGYNVLAITGALADSRAVTPVFLAKARCANIHGRNVSNAWGVTSELESMTDHPSDPGYAIPQAWAKAWHTNGFEGVRYMARFAPATPNCWAIFGPAGATTVEQGLTLHGRDVARRAGYEVDDGPLVAERFTLI